MVGTDIIDIEETKRTTHWQRPRFLEKLFTPQERRYIEDSNDAFSLVWQLWSMKESAYKLYTQLYPSRFYNPKQFECKLNASHGNIVYKTFECIVKTKKTKQYILSEARLNHHKISSKIITFENKNHKTQSESTRVMLIKQISKQFGYTSNVSVKTSKFGMPSVYHNSEPLQLSVAISHHGHYGTFAISELKLC